jgi:hypothetical protein
VITLIVALLGGAAISTAWAHPLPPQNPAAPDGVAHVAPPESAQPSSVSAPPRVDVTACAIALTTLGVLALTFLARRPLALALAVVVATFAFEGGIHSVHHLGSPSDAAHCAVAVAVTHAPGLVGETAVILVAPGARSIGAMAAPGADLVSGVHRAFHSRAPPAFSPARV